MQRLCRFIVMLLGVGLFSFSNPAQAVMFTVSDIVFSDLSGDDEALKWALTTVATPITQNVDVGDTWIFAYGTFTITDPINGPAGADNDDAFTASFNVMPPSPATPESLIGSPDATYVKAGVNTTALGFVDFDNDWMDRTFGVDGKYEISFLDTDEASRGITRDLLAKIHLTSYTEQVGGGGGADAVVPEPSTLILLGTGFLGLAVYRRKKQ